MQDQGKMKFPNAVSLQKKFTQLSKIRSNVQKKEGLLQGALLSQYTAVYGVNVKFLITLAIDMSTSTDCVWKPDADASAVYLPATSD